MTLTATSGGVADHPPGARLAAVLEGDVGGEHPVEVLRAEYRQRAHHQARVLRAMVDVARSRACSEEWASSEIGAALALTSIAADRQLSFAQTVVVHLPVVHSALLGGVLDRAKAWVFADHLGEVSAEQAAVICSALVPGAAGWTTGQLRARLLRMVHDVDPDHARRRYRRAVRDRAVVGHLAPNGTVTVTAEGLPADEAAVACERLDVLAAAVQRAGHPGRLWQIQADLFLGMLDGTFHHLAERQIIDALLGRRRAEDAGQPGGDEEATASDSAGEAEVAEAATRADEPRPDVGDASPADSVAPGPAGDAARDVAFRPPVTGSRRTGVEVRVGLLTMLGLDERCGEIPGLGPLLPHVARRLVAEQHRGAQWRFAVLDAEGSLVLAGTTRRRPRGGSPRPGHCRNGVVELHISVDELARLVHDAPEHSSWAAVIADIADQYGASLDGSLAPTWAGRRPRFVRGALEREVEVRDRNCSFVGCRRPARKSDKDHTRDHAHGGPTTRANVSPLCERHHRLKTEGWWTLRQPRPGRFEWTSPLGRIYRTRGEPIRPPTVPPSPRSGRPQPGPAARSSGPVLRRPTPVRRARRLAEPSPLPEDPPF